MNSSSTTMFGFYLGASVMVFAIYNLVHISLIFKGILLNVEYEQAMKISADQSILQNREGARTLREGNSTMIEIDITIAAIAFAGTGASATMLYTLKNKKELSVALIVSSVFVWICLIASARFINSATQFTVTQVGLNDAQRYMKGLLVKAFVARKIGYRLFYFSVVLCVGWVPALEGLLMFAAVLLLVFLYVISDTLSPAVVSRQNQGTIPLLPLRIENPTIHGFIIVQHLRWYDIARTLSIQVFGA